VDSEVRNGLERALRAVTNGAGSGEAIAGPSDTVSLVVKALPKLLENIAGNEARVERQNEALAELIKELIFVRRQLSALVQSHKRARAQLRQVSALQAMVVDHLARVQIIDPQSEAELGHALGGESAAESDEILSAARSKLHQQRQDTTPVEMGRRPPQGSSRLP